jgi:hypothetical protein
VPKTGYDASVHPDSGVIRRKGISGLLWIGIPMIVEPGPAIKKSKKFFVFLSPCNFTCITTREEVRFWKFYLKDIVLLLVIRT